MKTVTNSNSQVYYTGQYWNDYPQVQKYINANFSGDKNKTWQQDFKERYAPRPFKHGLFLNCGNGWVERQFIDMKITQQATAFDCSPDLLQKAIKLKGKRKIHYFQADVNTVQFKKNTFDLIVNVAALHHVQYLNRLCYILAKSLTKDGIFVSFDYIGPHRNQYPLLQWLLVKIVNRSLPSYMKKEPLDYPHLPTMLYTDPTEAIHSELLFKILPQYFQIIERHDTAGGIAYIILTHNAKMPKISPQQLEKNIQKILGEDKKYTRIQAVPPMFSYFICKAKKEDLRQDKLVKHRQEIEDLREQESQKFRNTYYLSEYLNLHRNRFFIKPSCLIRLPSFLISNLYQTIVSMLV